MLVVCLEELEVPCARKWGDLTRGWITLSLENGRESASSDKVVGRKDFPIERNGS